MEDDEDQAGNGHDGVAAKRQRNGAPAGESRGHGAGRFECDSTVCGLCRLCQPGYDEAQCWSSHQAQQVVQQRQQQLARRFSPDDLSTSKE